MPTGRLRRGSGHCQCAPPAGLTLVMPHAEQVRLRPSRSSTPYARNRRAPLIPIALTTLVLLATSCTTPVAGRAWNAPASAIETPASPASPDVTAGSLPTAASTSSTPSDNHAPGEFTFAFAGDVNFAERTATLLAADVSTVFGPAAAVLGAADLSMVNLETAITTAGTKQNKEFTFQAPPAALAALAAGGVDLASMANNHGADYGASGLQDTLAAISASGFPVVGIGANADAAYAPWRTTVRGTPIAVFAASHVRDETLANFSAGPAKAGIASAYSATLIAGVRAAKAAGDVVIVYLHWGTEYTSCPNGEQTGLASQLAAAGASAVVGAHVHELQGAGWRALMEPMSPTGSATTFGGGPSTTCRTGRTP
jgi:hypothetical protein